MNEQYANAETMQQCRNSNNIHMDDEIRKMAFGKKHAQREKISFAGPQPT